MQTNHLRSLSILHIAKDPFVKLPVPLTKRNERQHMLRFAPPILLHLTEKGHLPKLCPKLIQEQVKVW